MSDERIQRMSRLYTEEGLSYAEIGEREGITRQRVGQLIGPLGLASGRRRSKVAREQALRAAHERILAAPPEERVAAYQREAEALGYASGETVRAMLNELGLRILTEAPIPPHGTRARYTHRKEPCRCDECRRANREASALLKGREPPAHGTSSAYINYACRCKACKEAHRVYKRAQRAGRRKRREVKI